MNKNIIYNINRSLSGKKWKLINYNKNEIINISRIFNISKLISILLINKYIKINKIYNFLYPKLRNNISHPYHLNDMFRAINSTIKMIIKNNIIGIFGDYDVDGATSTALLNNYLKKLNIKTIIYIPDRIKEGYGPKFSSLNKLYQQGAKLIFTLDCGTVAFKELLKAYKKNINIIVIDHHNTSKRLPKTTAIINPQRTNQENETKSLSAVGVTFLFIIGLNNLLKKNNFFQLSTLQEPNLLNMLDLVALGTICDMVPLLDLNRAFIIQGLKKIQNSNNLGLTTLIKLIEYKEKNNITSSFLGFNIGPCINAGGRIGKSNLGAKLLITENKLIALKIAKKLIIYNKKRQLITKNILLEATIQIESQQKNIFILLTSYIWHQGIIGIIAGNIKNIIQKPTVIININKKTNLGKASVRSIIGFNIGKSINKGIINNLLIEGGGHYMAGGFSCLKQNIYKLNIFFSKIIKCMDIVPILKIDIILPIEYITIKTIYEINKLAPFGQNNQIPTILIHNAHFMNIKWIGKYKNHLKCILQSSFTNTTLDAIIFFAKGTLFEQIINNQKPYIYYILGNIQLNIWRNQNKPQIIISDIIKIN